jgi:hypothetical protein
MFMDTDRFVQTAAKIDVCDRLDCARICLAFVLKSREKTTMGPLPIGRHRR